jgi:lysophospholipase L1-like esterase
MKRRFQLAGLGCVLLACLSVSQAAEQAKPQSAVEPSRRDGGHLKRFKEFNKRLAQGNVDLLFIGDSITAGWAGQGKKAWGEYYARRRAVNLGRSGERTQHVLWLLDNLDVDKIAPKLAVVLIGTNNTRDNTAEEIAEGITRIIARLRKKLPKTQILLMAIFPRGLDKTDPQRQIVEKANRMIAKLADGERVVYLDLRDRFVKPDGTPTQLLRSDSVHIMPDGYRAWAEAIEPAVSKSLGPLPRAKSLGKETGEEGVGRKKEQWLPTPDTLPY